MTVQPNFARMTRFCVRCKDYRPIAGGSRTKGGRGAGQFICADCVRLERHARIISGTGNASEQRELQKLIQGLKQS